MDYFLGRESFVVRTHCKCFVGMNDFESSAGLTDYSFVGRAD